MNKKRRERIGTAILLLDKAYAIVDRVCDEEVDAHDNLPESLQETDRAYQMEAAADELEDAKNHLEEAKDALKDAELCLRSAAE